MFEKKGYFCQIAFLNWCLWRSANWRSVNVRFPIEMLVLFVVVANIDEEEVGRVSSLVERYVQENLLPSGLPIHLDFQVGLRTMGS